MTGRSLLGLYPAAWRQRYGEELEWLLEQRALGLRDRIDLIQGAVDAHLHPSRPSSVPVLATLTAGALSTAHAIALASQPVPLDWPGYLADALPLAVLAVVALLPAIAGLWLRLGDGDGAAGRIGIVLAVVGHGAWLAALLAAILQIEYGPLTAAASTLAMAGTALLGVALAGKGATVLGLLCGTAALGGVAPQPLGWPLFAAAWTAIGFVAFLDRRRRLASSKVPALA